MPNVRSVLPAEPSGPACGYAGDRGLCRLGQRRSGAGTRGRRRRIHRGLARTQPGDRATGWIARTRYRPDRLGGGPASLPARHGDSPSTANPPTADTRRRRTGTSGPRCRPRSVWMRLRRHDVISLPHGAGRRGPCAVRDAYDARTDQAAAAALSTRSSRGQSGRNVPGSYLLNPDDGTGTDELERSRAGRAPRRGADRSRAATLDECRDGGSTSHPGARGRDLRGVGAQPCRRVGLCRAPGPRSATTAPRAT